MRVYEYAKKQEVASKELLSLLSGEGFGFASHMSVLTDEALVFLDKHFSKKVESKKVVSKKVSEVSGRNIENKKVKQIREPVAKGKEKSVNIAKQRAVPQKKVPKSTFVKKESKLKEPKKIIIKPMILSDFADDAARSATEVILTLLKWGIVCAKNQMLPEEVVAKLAGHYELEVQEAVVKVEAFEKAESIIKGPQQERLPVVVVMGHVDHGKTTLLDFIRKSRVASREKGGITQHLGAYNVETSGGGIVFLDTPGHEAFSKIRMRGARAADIAVLVVAADDSIMPQTVEAINHAKSVNLPIVVAINKIDKAGSAQIERVKQDLTKYDLLPEDWGGDVVCAPISAKLGQGVEHLLDMISLQSQMMELKADRTSPARGYVLESKIEKGRGAVATVILQHGIAKVGDYFVCGKTFGKISSMVDSYSKRVKSVEPSIPVQVSGFDTLAEAGDFFEVVSQQEYKKARQGKREQKATPTKMMTTLKESLNLIVKADSDSSKEALLWAIEKTSKDFEKGFTIVHSAVGNVNESDIDLAAISGSLIVGLHVRTEPKASAAAQRLSVQVHLYDIIYKLVEFLQEYAESKKEVKKELRKIGDAVVLRVFNIKKIGVIAGCAVKDGRFSKDGSVVIYRGMKKIGEGKIKSLQREGKTVKEVHAGFECAFLIDGFSEWEVDDRVECYLEMTQEN